MLKDQRENIACGHDKLKRRWKQYTVELDRRDADSFDKECFDEEAKKTLLYEVIITSQQIWKTK